MSSKGAFARGRAGTLVHALLIGCISSAASAAETKPAGDSDLGRKVFSQVAQPSCTICHTLKSANANGKIGPDLDELKPDATRVAKAVRNGTGVMPPYQAQLTPEQIAAVASYVARATGAAK